MIVQPAPRGREGSGERRPKVVLYNPPAVFYTMPLALVAIGSHLDRSRYRVVIVDARLERNPIARLLEEAAEALCVGITVLTGDPIRGALEASRALRRSRPELPVVWGGWHPSLFPEECLEEPSVTLTVTGQGEVAFAEIVDRLAAAQRPEEIAEVPGVAGRREGATPPGPLAPLDDLVRHDYGLLDVERYFALKGRRQLDYISSIGCPFRCAFCADPFVYRRRWSGLSPDRVCDEIAALAEEHSVAELAFQDETFFTYPKRVLEIAQGFLDRGLRLRWSGTLRADQGARMSEEELELCARSGLSQVMVGVESGDQSMLDWMKKDATLDQVLLVAERCSRLGLAVTFNFIVGFPDERPEDLRATLGLIKRLRAMSPRFETPVFHFKPYPGSEITRQAEAAGFELPGNLEGWAEFDFVAGGSPWMADRERRLVDRFRFYNRFAGGPETWPRWPLQRVARWRCRRDFYSFPIEKLLVERLRPAAALS